MGEALLPAALIAYFSGIFLALLGVGTRSRGAQRAGIVSLGIAWCLHLAAIVRLAILTGHFPLSSMGEYLLVLSWAVLSAYLLLSLRFRMQGAGVLLPFLAFLMGATALAAPVKEIAVPDSHQQAWFIVHTTLATLGMAALCVAFGMSLIYLLQDAALKSKRTPRLLEVLPSLEVCDRVGYAAVLWGFPLLTLGILTGALWSASVHHRFFSGGAKQTFPILAWIVFAAVLYFRVAKGFRGRKSAYLTIAGFALGLLTLLGMNP
jgi:ABC-type transport system involved in cytochrome c biogenesis permease subunit